MIEEIKDTLKELTVEELRKVIWDYSVEEIAGFYNGEPIRLYLWEVKECGEVNPLLVSRCNVAEGWVEYLEVEDPDGNNLQVMLNGVKRTEDGNLMRTKVNCKLVIDLLDNEGNLIVTLS